MNAFEAAIKVAGLNERISALSDVAYYLNEDRDFSDRVAILNEIRDEMQTELSLLEDKLRSVNL
jgi:hypothetical protein